MRALPGRPHLDELATELSPLDWTWTEEDGPGFVVRWGRDDIAEAPGRGKGVDYTVRLLVHRDTKPYNTRRAGILPRVLNPEIFAPLLAEAIALEHTEGAVPVAFDWHRVQRHEAPALWHYLTVMQRWGVDATHLRRLADPLWSIYLSLPHVRTTRDEAGLRHHLERSSATIGHLAEERNPVLSHLGQVARADLGAAVQDRVTRELAQLSERAMAGMLRVATSRGTAHLRGQLAVAFARLRRTFRGFPEAVEHTRSVEGQVSDLIR